MNHLAHFKVSHPDPGLIVGSFLGDYVKGRLNGSFPSPIERGIRLHRAVDAFADTHPIVKQSVARFDPRFRRYGPIMTDVIYDHFLAQQWPSFDESELSAFSNDVFDVLNSCEVLPDKARHAAERMGAARSLEGYAREQFVDRSLRFIGSRLKRDNPLDEGFEEFLRHAPKLSDDFAIFFPELLSFCENWQAQN